MGKRPEAFPLWGGWAERCLVISKWLTGLHLTCLVPQANQSHNHTNRISHAPASHAHTSHSPIKSSTGLTEAGRGTQRVTASPPWTLQTQEDRFHTGQPVKFAFQINNNFSISIPRAIFVTCLKNDSNVTGHHPAFRFDKHGEATQAGS